MTMTIDNLMAAALDRHRRRTFGDKTLKIFTATPEAGETLAAEFATGWTARRIIPLTTPGTRGTGAGFLQFQIVAEQDWAVSQNFMASAVSVAVGDRRWRISKIEKPLGLSLIWKLRAESQ